MVDPWDWQDDGFKLDAECPLEITRCLWDQLPSSESDSQSLFSTPLTDITSQDLPFFSSRISDSELSAPHYDNSCLEGGSPRVKRRRLLFHEPHSVYGGCTAEEESDSVLDSFTTCVDLSMTRGSSDIQEFVNVDSVPPDEFWYNNCDQLSAALDSGCQVGLQDWIQDENTPFEENLKISPPVWPGDQHFRGVVAQGPSTPTPARPTLHRTKGVDPKCHISPPSTPYPKSSAPVAYPFTLLKPTETKGDITLKNINQRIMMPPSRPIPHVYHQPLQDSCLCSPASEGIGLSGKCIVARTKIHTEGKGTITIMRTRG